MKIQKFIIQIVLEKLKENFIMLTVIIKLNLLNQIQLRGNLTRRGQFQQVSTYLSQCFWKYFPIKIEKNNNCKI